MQAGTFEYGNGAFPANTAAALGIIADCQRYNRIAISISGLASETVSLTISYDYNSTSATGTFESATIRPIDLSTGALFASNNLGNGNFLLVNTPWRAIKLTKSAGVDSCTVRYGILNAN
jgi:hypothetical protein